LSHFEAQSLTAFGALAVQLLEQGHGRTPRLAWFGRKDKRDRFRCGENKVKRLTF